MTDAASKIEAAIRLLQEAVEMLAAEPMAPRSVHSKLGNELSRREQQVAVYLVSGISNKEIGSRMGISEQTVKNHIGTSFEKTGATSRTGLAMYAVEKGWVTYDNKSNGRGSTPVAVEPGTPDKSAV